MKMIYALKSNKSTTAQWVTQRIASFVVVSVGNGVIQPGRCMRLYIVVEL